MRKIEIGVPIRMEEAASSISFLYKFAKIKAFIPGAIAAVIVALRISAGCSRKMFAPK